MHFALLCVAFATLTDSFRIVGAYAFGECADAVRRCQYGIDGSSILRTEAVGQRLDPRSWIFSKLLQYSPANRSVESTVRVDETFLSTLELLYNNEDQLRTLLTLLKSDHSPPWLKFMRGYGECVRRDVIFTCVRDRCREYDMNALEYANTIFTENVVGFESFEDPFRFSVMLALKNRYTKTEKVVRVPVKSMSLFDAVFNTVKHYLLVNDMRDAPLLRKLDDLNRGLKTPFREEAAIRLLPRN